MLPWLLGFVMIQYCGVQALSGTGALRLAFEFYLKHLGQRAVYISKPTWGEWCVALVSTES